MTSADIRACALLVRRSPAERGPLTQCCRGPVDRLGRRSAVLGAGAQHDHDEIEVGRAGRRRRRARRRTDAPRSSASSAGAQLPRDAVGGATVRSACRSVDAATQRTGERVAPRRQRARLDACVRRAGRTVRGRSDRRRGPADRPTPITAARRRPLRRQRRAERDDRASIASDDDGHRRARWRVSSPTRRRRRLPAAARAARRRPPRPRPPRRSTRRPVAVALEMDRRRRSSATTWRRIAGQRPRRRGLHQQRLDPTQGVDGRVGVARRERAVVTGVHRLDRGQHFGASELADDQAIGAQTQGGPHERRQVDRGDSVGAGRTRLEPHRVASGERQFGGVLAHRRADRPDRRAAAGRPRTSSCPTRWRRTRARCSGRSTISSSSASVARSAGECSERERARSMLPDRHATCRRSRPDRSRRTAGRRWRGGRRRSGGRGRRAGRWAPARARARRRWRRAADDRRGRIVAVPLDPDLAPGVDHHLVDVGIAEVQLEHVESVEAGDCACDQRLAYGRRGERRHPIDLRRRRRRGRRRARRRRARTAPRPSSPCRHCRRHGGVMRRA